MPVTERKILSVDELCGVLDLCTGEYRWHVFRLLSHADEAELDRLFAVYPKDVTMLRRWRELELPTLTACEALRKLIYGW
jgi:hypothetical protein